MEYVLDNPAWYALNSGNSILANGEGSTKYFDIEVSPFVGLEEITTDNLLRLYDVLPHGGPALFMTTAEISIPEQWTRIMHAEGVQMVCETVAMNCPQTANITNLTAEHVPQMLALTQLTNPGPFAARTIEFGHYHGVFEGSQLVAMAGQRLLAGPYAEISAVCTHPDHTGKGYARQLLAYHIHRIITEGNIPFLHARHDNERAIKVYESLGFKKHQAVHFYAIKKADNR